MTYTLRYEQRPWTLNVERQGNHWRRAALVREWRTTFAWLALEQRIPPLGCIEVTATPEVKHRGSMPDTGACIGAVKAAIDGLVDAGVLEDDGPDQVTALTFCAPVVTGVDALTIRIESSGAAA